MTGHEPWCNLDRKRADPTPSKHTFSSGIYRYSHDPRLLANAAERACVHGFEPWCNLDRKRDEFVPRGTKPSKCYQLVTHIERH